MREAHLLIPQATLPFSMPDPYNTMQEAAGMLPLSYTPPPNPLMYPGMVSSAMQNGATGVFSAGAAQPPPAYAGPQGRSSPFFGPRIPTPQFDTPFQAAQSQESATQERVFRGSVSSYGTAARIAADFASAGIGAMVGRRFGASGIGAAVGFAGSEMSGLGGGAQNAMMNYGMAPAINMRAYGGGIEHLSRGFMAGGDHGNVTGSGMSHMASVRTARLLDDVSSSPRFQADTQDRFNRSDVMKIAQLGGREGLLNGATSPEQMTSKVRDLAKSLSSFMELANEPDVQRAIQTMGQMRSSGLNYGETLRAVSNGRSWARMAGTSFEQMAATGGAMGSQTYGAMGLTQGLGFQTGMGNLALARNSQMTGSVSPQMMALMGGVHGAAGMSNAFSGAFLQQPMLAPGVMSGMGGLDEGRVRQLLSGQTDLFKLTGNSVGALGGMTRGMGIEGLGLAIASQPMMQDALGRIMESQGPFARRGVEDQQIMGLMRRMGHRGSAGYALAGQAMGLDRTQSLARARELGSSDHYDRQLDQVEAQRRERRTTELRDVEAGRPGILSDLESESPGFSAGMDMARGARRGVQNLYESIAHGTPYSATSFGTREARDRYDRYSREHGLEALHGAGSRGESAGWGSRFQADRAIYGASGATGALLNVGSAISATFGSDDARQGEIRGLRRLSRMGQDIMQTSAAEAASAQRFLGKQGIDEGALGAFGSAVGGISSRTNTAMGGAWGAGVANSLVRGGAQLLTGGLVDPGNIAGSRSTSIDDVRSTFARSMQGRGWDASRSNRFFDENRTTLMQGASSYARAYMDERGLARWNDTIQAGQRVGASQQDPENAERAAYGVLGAGASNVRERRALDTIADSAQGVGRGDTAEKSRRALTVIRTLQTQRTGPRGAAALQRMREVQEELFRTGNLSQEEKQAFLAQMEITNNSSRGDEQAGLAGQHMLATGRNGAALLNQFTQTEDGRNRETFRRRFRMGAESLGGQGGAMGALFEGATDDESLRRNVTRVAGDEAMMGGLDESTRRDVAAANRGDKDAMGRIANLANRRGRTGEQAERRYDKRWYARLFSTEQSVFDSASDFRRREMARGTGADRDAERSEQGIEATRRQAGDSGIGGQFDQLAEVTRNLDRVTHNLAAVAESNHVDSLLGRRD